MTRVNVKVFPCLIFLVIILFAMRKVWDDVAFNTATVGEGQRDPTVSKTGGDILKFFEIPDGRAVEVKWAHRVNTMKHLDYALNNGSAMMLEADVQLKNDTPVMAHDLKDANTSDITLENWLSVVINANRKKGIKLDFKSTAVLEPSLKILKSLESALQMPIWLNADILQGPNSIQNPVDAKIFFLKVQTLFPHSTLSIGWTTAYNTAGNNLGYDQMMVEKMYEFCGGMEQIISFPVRASLTAMSIPPLQWLIQKSDRFSLTVWQNPEEKVPTDDLVKISKAFDKSKVFYDLPDGTMNAFKQALEREQ